MQDQLIGLLDPFAVTDLPAKYHDGSASHSAGIKIRHSTKIICSTTVTTNLLLCPGFVFPMQGTGCTWSPEAPIFKNHMESEALRAGIKQVRLISTALRLSMLNNADQNDGYWEAARIPVNLSDWSLAVPGGDAYLTGSPGAIDSLFTDLSNHTTYQTGKLRDLHRMQFKLDSFTHEHPFTSVKSVLTNVSADVDQMFDQTFDIVLLKIYGRTETGSPTTLHVQVASNQEVIYKENTSLGRLMTPCLHDPDHEEVCQASKYGLPAVQIS
jgi:hypothetical protein